MSKILLSADSTCDISGELLERTKVQLFPLHIILGEKSYELARKHPVFYAEHGAEDRDQQDLSAADDITYAPVHR